MHQDEDFNWGQLYFPILYQLKAGMGTGGHDTTPTAPLGQLPPLAPHDRDPRERVGSAAEPCSALIPFLIVDLHFGGLSTALPPATRVSQRPPAPPAVAAEPPIAPCSWELGMENLLGKLS